MPTRPANPHRPLVRREADRPLAPLERARRLLAETRSVDVLKELRDQAEALRLYAKQRNLSRVSQNDCAEIKLRAERRIGEILRDDPTYGRGKPKSPIVGDLHLDDHQAARWQRIAAISVAVFDRYIAETKADPNGEITTIGALKLTLALRRPKMPGPIQNGDAAPDCPTLWCGNVLEVLPRLPPASVDLVITSPPYNVGPSGGTPEIRIDGRRLAGNRAWAGIRHEKIMPELAYQDWQVRVLQELHRVAKSGASLFYNHKVRQRNRRAVFPHTWVLRPDNPWVVRQELIWDRGSTHNHEATYFWPHDERVFWMTKGTPTLPDHPINIPTVLRMPGAGPSGYHDSPFPLDLPRLILEAVGQPGWVVLDPFCGSGTALAVALESGCRGIGIDLDHEVLLAACARFGWPTTTITLSGS